MKNFFDFSLPLESGTLLTTVRLTVGGIASAAGLDLDACEDFKVCVTEGLLLFKRNGRASAKAHCEFTGEGLVAELTAGAQTGAAGESWLENEISYALLGALVDEASFDKDESGAVTAIRLVKKIGAING